MVVNSALEKRDPLGQSPNRFLEIINFFAEHMMLHISRIFFPVTSINQFHNDFMNVF